MQPMQPSKILTVRRHSLSLSPGRRPKDGGFNKSMAMQEPIDWRYRFHIFLAYFLENIPTKHGQTYGTNVAPF